MSTFTFVPEFGAQRSVTPKVDVVKFGDGYENRVPSGINFKMFNWNLQFNYRDNVEGPAILAFLETCGGVQSFDWQPPMLNKTYKFVCRTWSHTVDHANIWSIQATFERVYEP